ncbi:MAG: hypothetical protein LQ351_000120 [Letrouitia transgressa]|nr:MAG: hypothetical protein LQ351_000120 [Letrouitia transgressa]
MGLGVLEPTQKDQSSNIPGTAILFDDGNEGARQKLKGSIVLVPQPSLSPRDPLNWALWKKDIALLAMCLSITVGGIQDSLLSTVNGILAEEFELSIEKIENLSSYPLLASGVTCAIASILARILGKRPIYIVSTSLLLATCIWSALIKRSYGSFFTARIISGVGLGSYEALVLSSIGDMYFVGL